MMSDKNPFDYFDKIFCINLDSRPDRWESVQKEFDKVGILNKVERFSALSGTLPSGPQGKNVKGKLFWKNIDGCAMSEFKCVKIAKDLNLKNVLIFEDDVFFKNYDKESLLRSVESLMTENWKLFYLGGNIIDRNISEKFKEINNDLVKVNLPIYTTHSYAVNHTVFDQILGNRFLKVDWKLETIVSHHKRIWTIDKFLGDKVGDTYTIKTPMCFQVDGISDINNEEINQTKMSLESYTRLFK